MNHRFEVIIMHGPRTTGSRCLRHALTGFCIVCYLQNFASAMRIVVPWGVKDAKSNLKLMELMPFLYMKEEVFSKYMILYERSRKKELMA